MRKISLKNCYIKRYPPFIDQIDKAKLVPPPMVNPVPGRYRNPKEAVPVEPSPISSVFWPIASSIRTLTSIANGRKTTVTANWSVTFHFYLRLGTTVK